MPKKLAPYGTWDSPITAEAITHKSIAIDDVIVDPVTHVVYHIEKRPSEQGRNFLVNTVSGQDVIPKGYGTWNVRTGVQEYGGGAAIARDGVIYFSNYEDGRLYRVVEGQAPEPVTPVNTYHRFANFTCHPTRPGLLVSILEDHTNPEPSAVLTYLVLINALTSTVTKLISGADFYSSPTFSPDGAHLAWLEWYNPDMPWEGAELRVTSVSASPDGRALTLGRKIHVAGKKLEVSVAYPSWITNDAILFTSDESGYQNPWIYSLSASSGKPVMPSPLSLDFSSPAWVLGGSHSVVLTPDGEYTLFVVTKDGRGTFFLVSPGKYAHEFQCPYVSVSCVRLIGRPGLREVDFVFIGTKSDEPRAVIRGHMILGDHASTFTFSIFKSTASPSSPLSAFSKEFISTPQPMTLTIPPGNEPLHVVFYPPKHPGYEGSSIYGEKPPCVVNIHGGPTALEGQGLLWHKQYFTTRGWAWLDVNYGGSSGYGRQYIQSLKGNWGLVDVQDAINAARALSTPSSRGPPIVDAKRLVIRGGSAGGYTVLASLSLPAADADLCIFAAGTSMYGISDLKKLCEGSHKFESRYLEKLVGGTWDEIPDVYKARSPLEKAGRIKRPLLILQGSIDKVVLPEQAEMIVESIRRRGGQVVYRLFEGEGHGWRKAETIRDALEMERKFYEDVLGIGEKPFRNGHITAPS